MTLVGVIITLVAAIGWVIEPVTPKKVIKNFLD